MRLFSFGPVRLQSSVQYILDQKYIGDITIVPSVSLQEYTLLLRNPTHERVQHCVRISQRATWQRTFTFTRVHPPHVCWSDACVVLDIHLLVQRWLWCAVT